MTKPPFIAEIKTRSPFGFKSEEPWDDLFALASEHGDWVAVHTHPAWGGSFELLSKARAATRKPILAKGIHATDDEVQRALDLGVDYILTVGRISSLAKMGHTIFEPLTMHQMLLPIYADPCPSGLKVMWNCRNLITGGWKDERWSWAANRPDLLGVRQAYRGWLCQASGIRKPKNVMPDADAFIVGTHLRTFIETKLKTER